MSIESHRVVIGACSWLHQSWINDYYPEDLPEDWRLGFYSNEFPLVYLAAADWIDAVDFSDWVEEVAETFRFILELPDYNLDETAYKQALDKARVLADYCLGLVIRLNPAACRDLNQLESRLKEAKCIAPVCIDSRNLTLAKECQILLSRNNISEVWYAEEDEKIVIPEDRATFTRGNLALCRVSGDQLDIASLRIVIEACLVAATNQRVSVLCIDGQPPSLELLRNANVLLNLL